MRPPKDIESAEKSRAKEFPTRYLQKKKKEKGNNGKMKKIPSRTCTAVKRVILQISPIVPLRSSLFGGDRQNREKIKA